MRHPFAVRSIKLQIRQKKILLKVLKKKERIIRDGLLRNTMKTHQPIITSLLDTDLYKLTQQQIVFHQYPTVTAKYEFRCRNQDVKLGFLAEPLRQEINTWKEITLTESEYSYLKSKIGLLKADYIRFLNNFRFDPDLVEISVDKDDNLIVLISGKWVSTILFEVPLLAAINELYFRSKFSKELKLEGEKRLENKLGLLNKIPNLNIMEFGTRRRFSKEWQDEAFRKMLQWGNFTGTSNVNLAMKYKSVARGTMAHEFFSAHIALVENIREAQKRALHVWLQEYGENLGIALSDTFTSVAFFQDFDKVLANAYSGVRHDSGDPKQFGFNVINHYKRMGIDPRTKTIVFSDGLNIPKAIDLFETFTGLIGLTFGIGTDLTNDMGIPALNIVIKMVECNGKPVVKLSDNDGKHIGDENVINKVKLAYGL